jgi:hypothetical protein
MARMSTKSRQTIYGGRIIGAKIRAEGAREAAKKAVREADRAEAEAWSIRMEGYGGAGATVANDRAMRQWRLWLVTGQMPSLRDRGQHPARLRSPAAGHADMET